MIELKTVVVGDTDAGKTSLSELHCYGDVAATTGPTIGASFLQKQMHLEDEFGESYCNAFTYAVHLLDISHFNYAGNAAIMGYGRPGTLPQHGSYVLPRSDRSHHCF